MRINFVGIAEKVEQILRGWEATAPEQSFADMTLEQFKQALQPFFAAKAAFEGGRYPVGFSAAGTCRHVPQGAGARDGYCSLGQRPSQVRCELRHVRGDGLHDEWRAKLGAHPAAGCRNAEGDGLIEGSRNDRTT